METTIRMWVFGAVGGVPLYGWCDLSTFHSPIALAPQVGGVRAPYKQLLSTREGDREWYVSLIWSQPPFCGGSRVTDSLAMIAVVRPSAARIVNRCAFLAVQAQPPIVAQTWLARVRLHALAGALSPGRCSL